MKKKLFLIFSTLFFAVSLSLAAQGGEASNYVSRIRAESRNNLIRLTWADSADARGPVYIYRSARPFPVSVPANIRPIVVSYGVQYYIDDTDDMENVFYFIAASEVSGRIYDLIIPGINSTSVYLSQQQDEASAASPPAAAEIQPPVQARGISNLRASREGEAVIITFLTTDTEKKIVLYRSMQPIRQPLDLLNAVVVRSGVSSPFTDFPVQGFTWYYAVIFEEEISGVNMEIRPGINATVTGLSISNETAEQSLRPIPLPMLALQGAVSEGFFLPEVIEHMPLSAEAASMLRDMQLNDKIPHTHKTPRVFVADLQAPSSGEESALFQIVNEYFIPLDWENARAALEQYLSLPRSKDVEARARFYLGQTLYYTGRYRDALLEFLFIRSTHAVEANNWIAAILSAMVD